MNNVATNTLFFNQWMEQDAQKFAEMDAACAKAGLGFQDAYLLINVTTQRLHLIALKRLTKSYPISTAKNGVGQKEGTGQTPLGLHFVAEKIGDGAKPLAIFRSRISTGELAKADEGEQCIVSRIIRLKGAQLGFNAGKDVEGNVVDTHDRYIYIHGTNDIANIGKPVSSGCIRMTPDDVIDLFGQLPEKTPVYVYCA